MDKQEMFELKLEDGKVIKWEGRDGLDACHRYADSHPGIAVIAWRYPRYELRIGMPRTIVGPNGAPG